MPSAPRPRARDRGAGPRGGEDGDARPGLRLAGRAAVVAGVRPALPGLERAEGSLPRRVQAT